MATDSRYRSMPVHDPRKAMNTAERDRKRDYPVPKCGHGGNIRHSHGARQFSCLARRPLLLLAYLEVPTLNGVIAPISRL
jgi:hypothetical protein